MGSPARGIARNFSGWSNFVRNVVNQSRETPTGYANILDAVQYCLKQGPQTTIGIERDQHEERSNRIKRQRIAGLGGHGSDLTQIEWTRSVYRITGG
jgi:hypothetical protein